MNSQRPGAVYELGIHGLRDLPLIHPGDDLAGLISEALLQSDFRLTDGDVVVAQKIVSKAEGRQVRLSDVRPSTAAVQLAAGVLTAKSQKSETETVELNNK